MAELKTKKNDASVDAFIRSVADPKQREDSQRLVQFMGKVTGSKPKMWGASIVGFGEYHYVYPSGREGDWFLAGFSPRKGNLTLYVMGCSYLPAPALKQLGKFKMGKSCIYVKKLEDIDLAALAELMRMSMKRMKSIEKEQKK